MTWLAASVFVRSRLGSGTMTVCLRARLQLSAWSLRRVGVIHGLIITNDRLPLCQETILCCKPLLEITHQSKPAARWSHGRHASGHQVTAAHGPYITLQRCSHAGSHSRLHACWRILEDQTAAWGRLRVKQAGSLQKDVWGRLAVDDLITCMP